MAIGLTNKQIAERLSAAFTIEEMKEAVQALMVENNRLIERQLHTMFQEYLTENHYEIDDGIEDGMQIRFH
ncbi:MULTISPECIES: hypothetical protein [Aneurinibacillus]|uniref:Uncharacterized protein n=1 Tax=Aneurinibacillus thermoaerophilus TaxID=143495 RepID=A0A1G8EZS1_ANETH|nr:MULTISPECIES: hypothetical protein [Aneurinibacillus]AMA73420.1 hypothetical protein ACH33_11515 [Aneurinibacillus sp. XH2]MED0677573.1 hypothetical protein [Aneurinibacillus thermoaerophilus]MED0680605.1 hypothetical protein [Aneurinibacillus thermoaerophilus]MED0738927.1 hypothetical protein [Aneurinibacillus thermoaerophilus]MED0758591.1 hypothetical protein [Aneurinibacillus thermoaerophilus]